MILDVIFELNQPIGLTGSSKVNTPRTCPWSSIDSFPRWEAYRLDANGVARNFYEFLDIVHQFLIFMDLKIPEVDSSVQLIIEFDSFLAHLSVASRMCR